MSPCESQVEMCVVDSEVIDSETQIECGELYQLSLEAAIPSLTWGAGAYMLEQYINAGHRYTYTSVHQTTAGWTIGGQLGVKMDYLDPKFTFAWSKTVTTGHSVGANKDCGADLGHNGLLGNWSVKPNAPQSPSANLRPLTGPAEWQSSQLAFVSEPRRSICTCTLPDFHQ